MYQLIYMSGIVLSAGNRAVNRLDKSLYLCEVYCLEGGETDNKERSKDKNVCQVVIRAVRKRRGDGEGCGFL